MATGLEFYKDVASIGSSLVTASSFAFGAFQYWKGSQWKEKEFVAKEMQAFFQKPGTATALRLLDWTDWDIAVPPSQVDGKIRMVKVSEAFLAAALRNANDEDGFDDDEIVIRDAFDSFFEGLTHLQIFVDSRLIKAGDLKPYLAYVFELLSGRRPHKNKEVLGALDRFVTERDLIPVRTLMASMGYKINE